jgi:hypothetical protein
MEITLERDPFFVLPLLEAVSSLLHEIDWKIRNNNSKGNIVFFMMLFFVEVTD